MPKPLSEFYRVDPVSGCWIFRGTLDRWGYGKMWRIRRTPLAHRYFYEELVGAIPEGLELDHLCRNKHCVNPDHCEPVTPEENNRRRRKTHCKRGHALEEGNLTRRRHCLTCSRRQARLYMRARRHGGEART